MLDASLLSVTAAGLAAARLLIGLWLILSGAQLFAAAGAFAPAGPLAWAHLALARSGRWHGAARRRMSVTAWRLLTAAIVASGGALVAGIDGGALSAVLVVTLVLYGTMLALSGEFWADGSDKIGMLALAGTALAAIGVRRADPALAFAGLLLTGGQLVLCYVIAGLSKLPDARWRDGTMLVAVMERQWGHAGLSRLLRGRGMARLASWSVILLEALFPLALLLPPPALAVALAAMMAFHVATAVLMGLNRFPWAFACAYPATLALGALTARALGWTS